MNKSYIHLYTGNGKGKTTAAIGLAIRAVGAGKRIYIAQFVKGMPYAELEALKRFPEIDIQQFGRDCFIKKAPVQADIDAARKGLNKAKELLSENKYDLIILDEICIALHYNLFKTEEVLTMLKNRKSSAEIILTGRYAPAALSELADLHTEMKDVRVIIGGVKNKLNIIIIQVLKQEKV